ncbi:MAG: hypothetical protein N2646_05580 [Bellilinea sp.]|nr:hypothetical protein [Bellilinea sp.]
MESRVQIRWFVSLPELCKGLAGDCHAACGGSQGQQASISPERSDTCTALNPLLHLPQNRDAILGEAGWGREIATPSAAACNEVNRFDGKILPTPF